MFSFFPFECRQMKQKEKNLLKKKLFSSIKLVQTFDATTSFHFWMKKTAKNVKWALLYNFFPLFSLIRLLWYKIFLYFTIAFVLWDQIYEIRKRPKWCRKFFNRHLQKQKIIRCNKKWIDIHLPLSLHFIRFCVISYIFVLFYKRPKGFHKWNSVY